MTDVGVIGLGYVRLPVAVAFAEHLRGTVGFDINPRRIEQLRRGLDVTREIDLVEEVGRHAGFDRIPTTYPAARRFEAGLDPRITWDGLARKVLTSAGFSEAVTFALIERAAADLFVGASDALVPIANPLSEKFAVLRPSLLPGLLDAVVHNRRRERRDVRLFEISASFSTRGGERRRAALALTGFGLYPDLTVAENLDFFMDIYGIAGAERHRRRERYLTFSNLLPFVERQAGDLSGGMKQKLGLACVLVHEPRVLILDEPTNGVDPVIAAGVLADPGGHEAGRHDHPGVHRLPGRGRALRPAAPDAQPGSSRMRFPSKSGRGLPAWRRP